MSWTEKKMCEIHQLYYPKIIEVDIQSSSIYTLIPDKIARYSIDSEYRNITIIKNGKKLHIDIAINDFWKIMKTKGKKEKENITDFVNSLGLNYFMEYSFENCCLGSTYLKINSNIHNVIPKLVENMYDIKLEEHYVNKLSLNDIKKIDKYITKPKTLSLNKDLITNFNTKFLKNINITQIISIDIGNSSKKQKNIYKCHIYYDCIFLKFTYKGKDKQNLCDLTKLFCENYGGFTSVLSPIKNLYKHIDNSPEVHIMSNLHDDQNKTTLICDYLINCLKYFPDLEIKDFFSCIIIKYYLGFYKNVKSARFLKY